MGEWPRSDAGLNSMSFLGFHFRIFFKLFDRDFWIKKPKSFILHRKPYNKYDMKNFNISPISGQCLPNFCPSSVQFLPNLPNFPNVCQMFTISAKCPVLICPISAWFQLFYKTEASAKWGTHKFHTPNLVPNRIFFWSLRARKLEWKL